LLRNRATQDARQDEEDAVLRPPAAGLVAAFGAVLVAGGSVAAPPDNADPALAPWFQSLKQPGSGMSCCSIADCRPVDYRLASDHYEAYLDKDWVRVPDDKILRGKINPLARGVVCRSPISGAILCFVPANEI
jgi:hypothetical protein